MAGSFLPRTKRLPSPSLLCKLFLSCFFFLFVFFSSQIPVKRSSLLFLFFFLPHPIVFFLLASYLFSVC